MYEVEGVLLYVYTIQVCGYCSRKNEWERLRGLLPPFLLHVQETQSKIMNKAKKKKFD